MTWLIVIAVVIVVALVLFGCWWTAGPSGSSDYRAVIELHAIRKRFDVAEFKLEVRRDAARARRELRAELDELDGRGR